MGKLEPNQMANGHLKLHAINCSAAMCWTFGFMYSTTISAINWRIYALYTQVCTVENKSLIYHRTKHDVIVECVRTHYNDSKHDNWNQKNTKNDEELDRQREAERAWKQ